MPKIKRLVLTTIFLLVFLTHRANGFHLGHLADRVREEIVPRKGAYPGGFNNIVEKMRRRVLTKDTAVDTGEAKLGLASDEFQGIFSQSGENLFIYRSHHYSRIYYGKERMTIF